MIGSSQYHSRDAILQLIHKAGQAQLFYRWLLQHDLLKDEVETVTHKILATCIWTMVYHFTRHTVDTMPITQLYDLMTHIRYFRVEADAVQPPETSPWHTFYLTPSAFTQAITYLDEVIEASFGIEAPPIEGGEVLP